ncbi:5' exonuclease Apollo isoform X2 [Hyalella azteca]|uniref:5' exonuclease Apollo isoform X2 n=1 Tax=Hyalella azteca TaxID=294128 RepID=A0A979FLQ7_HYAAZ|nr:5' exonuclease Apollo isoform X2 [Hyalella azteca]
MSCHQSGNGMVIPGTPIAIDFWNVILKPQAKVFFLTHCHSDHLEGLTSTWRQPIYTTSFNAHWLAKKRKIALATFIIVEAGTSVEVPLDLTGQNKALVTAIDANHVPGAVMFLLQGYFGTILYTGDFRYYPEMPLQPGLNNLQAGDVDVLYLDNTYCHPIYNFPSRDDASLIILNIIKCHPKHRIKLGCRNLGREELYLFLGVQMDELVLVPPAVLLSLQLLRAPEYFTTDPAQSRIHLVPLAQVTSHRKATSAGIPNIRPSASVHQP